jgi:NADPH:quinone reductase-like Zn-dependent oxidoreductase
MVATHVVRQVAEVTAGGQVLVHEAGRPIGLASVQVARQAGATVYATASTVAEHELLASLGVARSASSHSLDFAAEIIDLTEGRGVDVVVNTLADGFVERSLAVLARGGRFVQMGAPGVWDEARVHAFRPDVSFHVVSARDVFAAEPEYAHLLLHDVLEGVAGGSYRPVPFDVVAPAPDEREANAHGRRSSTAMPFGGEPGAGRELTQGARSDE